MSVEEAMDTLRYLRDEAASHTFISTWLVVELVDAALEQFNEKAPALSSASRGRDTEEDVLDAR